eukprot:NODE_172_length_3374_cov_30.201169_g150_i0.p1 GENE.NODE_172_length_3374_cov_30.201169_g150_i0~~NODE_172_length_3374_cov_30.201169_g150_i0.p1  ORF type:complete len:777 (+),score=88.17 NODE_172_length_3374_cov_30.201169_g150_i0:871-3201(+)
MNSMISHDLLDSQSGLFSSDNATIDRYIIINQGLCKINDAILYKPKVGIYEITAQLTNLKISPVLFTITFGDPYRLKILQQPSPYTDNVKPLVSQPIIELVDISDNRILDYINAFIGVELLPPSIKSIMPFMNLNEEGLAVFSSITIMAAYGTNYELRFYFNGQCCPNVIPVVSNTIQTTPCQNDQFYINGSYSCSECPKGAQCNSSDIIVTKNNYWRLHSQTLTFIECGSNSPCLGSVSTGECKLGYQGILCSYCQDGYSGDDCTKCPSDLSYYWTIFVVIISVAFLFCTFTIIMALRKDPNKRHLMTVCYRMAISHLQVAAQFGEIQNKFPIILRTMYRGQNSGSNFIIPTSFMDCIFPSITPYNIFFMYMFIPLSGVIIGVLVIFYSETLGFNTKRHLLTQEQKESRRRYGLITKGKTTWQIFVISVGVMIFFFYTTLIQQCVSMIICNQLDFGEPIQSIGSSPTSEIFRYGNYLKLDMSIDCESPTYRTFKYIPRLFLILYGAGVPLLLLCISNFIGRLQGEEKEIQTFAFLVAGYKKNVRYWEVTVMVRKLIIVVIVSYVDSNLQLYLSIWIITFFLLLQLYFKPFTSKIANYLETISLAVMYLILSLACLYNFQIATEGSFGFYSITIVIFLLQVLMILSLVFVAMWDAKSKIKEILAQINQNRAKINHQLENLEIRLQKDTHKNRINWVDIRSNDILKCESVSNSNFSSVLSPAPQNHSFEFNTPPSIRTNTSSKKYEMEINHHPQVVTEMIAPRRLYLTRNNSIYIDD